MSPILVCVHRARLTLCEHLTPWQHFYFYIYYFYYYSETATILYILLTGIWIGQLGSRRMLEPFYNYPYHLSDGGINRRDKQANMVKIKLLVYTIKTCRNADV